MHLSKRLERVASFVKEGSVVADIGTDHGYIPIYLVKEKRAVSAIAMDVRTGPLSRAKEHIAEYGLTDRISVRLSDGLEKLCPNEADTVVIAGMGGELMIRILRQGRHMWESVRQWVLSPQSELAQVRRFLAQESFLIEKEDMLEEDGKFYVILSVGREAGEKRENETSTAGKGPCGQQDTCRKQDICEKQDICGKWDTCEKQDAGIYIETEEYSIEELYGACLLRERHPVLYDFLVKERAVKQQILQGLSGQTKESAVRRRQVLERELLKNEEALRIFEKSV